MRSNPFVSLQLNDSYKPVTDGVAVCAENYARWLNRDGVPTALAAPWSPNYEDTDEFPVYRYTSAPIPGWKPYRAGLPAIDPAFHVRIRYWLDHLKEIHDVSDLFHQSDENRQLPVVLHAHAPFASGALGRTLRHRMARRGRKALLVATLHSKYHEDFSRSLPEPIVDQVLRVVLRHFEAADAVWTPNRGTAETLREYGFTGPIDVVPNGSDLVQPDREEYQRLRGRGGELIGVNGDETVLLFVGQQRWEKNIGLVLKALARLSSLEAGADGGLKQTGLPRRRMVFVGDGPDRAAIKRLAVELGLMVPGGTTGPGRAGGGNHRRKAPEADSIGATGAVQFYGHVAEREELKALYARSDLFVFPSIYDNAPLVVREAAAFGTASILATGSHAAGDTVDGRNAFHVNPEPEALAKLLERLLKSPDLVARVGQAAATEVFRSWEDVVSEVRDRYAELVKPGTPD